MPSFVSQFHLPRPGGAERAAWEKAVAEEKKCHRHERVRKHEVCQKRGASPSSDDDDDDNEDVKDEEEDPMVLQGVPDAP